VYVYTAMAAEWLNIFVLIVQAFLNSGPPCPGPERQGTPLRDHAARRAANLGMAHGPGREAVSGSIL